MRSLCSSRGLIGLAFAVAGPILGSVPCSAQVIEIGSTEEVDFDRPEAWAMKYFTAVALLTGQGVPDAVEAGALELGFELGSIPSLSEDERRVGFDGTKVESLDRSDVFGRPRVSIGLPGDVLLTLAWVPPVELDGATPNFVSLAIGRPLVRRDSWRLGARLVAQTGSVEGDFTCSADEAAAGGDREQNPFGCTEPSEDESHHDVLGLELGAALTTSDRFEPYATLIATHMELEFQVNARYAGLLDRQRLVTDGWTWAATLGSRFELGERLSATAELFYSPLDVRRPPDRTAENDALFNLRVLVAYRLR